MDGLELTTWVKCFEKTGDSQRSKKPWLLRGGKSFPLGASIWGQQISQIACVTNNVVCR